MSNKIISFTSIEIRFPEAFICFLIFITNEKDFLKNARKFNCLYLPVIIKLENSKYLNFSNIFKILTRFECSRLVR